jgi:hypothetical protein
LSLKKYQNQSGITRHDNTLIDGIIICNLERMYTIGAIRPEYELGGAFLKCNGFGHIFIRKGESYYFIFYNLPLPERVSSCNQFFGQIQVFY